jgi:hypothetical protein
MRIECNEGNTNITTNLVVEEATPVCQRDDKHIFLFGALADKKPPVRRLIALHQDLCILETTFIEVAAVK